MTHDISVTQPRADAAAEALRTRTVEAYDVDSARASGAFADIAAFVGQLCDAPVVLVSLMSGDSQHLIARTGIEADVLPRATSFCQHTLLGTDLIEVPDTSTDPRFADNPFVTGETHVRFYAGMPMTSPDGVVFGTVCVIDMTPRPDGLTPLQREGLRIATCLATSRLDDRRAAREYQAADAEARRALEDSEMRFRTLADTMPQMVWSTLPDGFHDYYNARWYEFTGAPAGTTDGEGWNDVFHPDDQDRAWSLWRQSLATGAPYSIEYRLRHNDGTYRWVLGRALPIRDEQGTITRWFGTCTDIHEQKLALEEREVISQELSHRIKNIFAVISGLISFSARQRPEFAGIAADLRARITALGRAHDFVRPHSNQSRPSAAQDSLHGLLADLFAPYQAADETRITIAGDDMTIDDRSATPIALLFHELATNATKYGALSTGDGTVTVRIDQRSSESGEAGVVTIHWAEAGGPAITEPSAHSGFGSQLIEMSAVRQLGGSVMRDWRAEGLIVDITIPGASLSRPGAPG